ncbi:hypothetical protein HanPSC8_Chr02g0054451 [Helianthus annuus]|nr:hypothetical protein HanPSC8_Chr02g0054451 [Helianthus annuus]
MNKSSVYEPGCSPMTYRTTLDRQQPSLNLRAFRQLLPVIRSSQSPATQYQWLQNQNLVRGSSTSNSPQS